MMIMIVDAMSEKIESNMRCPSHNPAVFVRPLENCMADSDGYLDIAMNVNEI